MNRVVAFLPGFATDACGCCVLPVTARNNSSGASENIGLLNSVSPGPRSPHSAISRSNRSSTHGTCHMSHVLAGARGATLMLPGGNSYRP